MDTYDAHYYDYLRREWNGVEWNGVNGVNRADLIRVCAEDMKDYITLYLEAAKGPIDSRDERFSARRTREFLRERCRLIIQFIGEKETN